MTIIIEVECDRCETTITVRTRLSREGHIDPPRFIEEDGWEIRRGRAYCAACVEERPKDDDE